MIKATNISFGYTEKPLYENGNFLVADGMKVGLVGQNGTGKSTLFNLLLKRDEPENGRIEVSGTVGYVPQEVKRDNVLEKAKEVREYVDPQNKKSDYELQTIFNGLELNFLPLSASLQKLSGGQKTKLALARALIEEPDILLLDEPTNFLDVKGKIWVMNFLSHYPHTLILVSHDLQLLNQYIDKIISISDQKIKEYSGNYTTYLITKKQEEDLLRRQIINEQKHIKQMKKGLIKMDRYSSEKGVRQRNRLKWRIEKIEAHLPDLPKEVRTITFTLPEPTRLGEVPLIVHNVYKSFENKKVLEDISLSIERNERVALIGHNGAGKSTFIKIIMGLLEQDRGEVLRDEKIKIGYYSQEFENFDLQKTIIDMANDFSMLSDHIIRPLLAKFMFTGKKIYQKVETLSGGEKTRLAIALLLLKDFNFLVLDEPTTYLDVLSQRVILEALKEYKGTMLVVSHTEEFIKELQPTKVLLLPENKVRTWTPELLERISEI